MRKSGRFFAPVVEIDDHLLIDTDADEVGRYLDRVAEDATAAS